MQLRHIIIASLFVLLAGSCSANTPSDGIDVTSTPIIQINTGEQEKRIVGSDRVLQDNCNGSALLTQTLEKSRSIQYLLQAEAGLTINADGSVGIPEVGNVSVGASVATKYGVQYGSTEVLKRTIQYSAKEGTKVIHTVNLVEVMETGEFVVTVGTKTIKYPYKFLKDFGLDYIEATQEICPLMLVTIAPPATTTTQATATKPIPTQTAVTPSETPAPTDIPVLPTNTVALSTPTIAPPTNTPIPATETSTPAPQLTGSVPAGKWTVRAFKVDDAGAIWVDGKMVGVAQSGRDTDWININEFFQPDKDTIVAFASFNRRYESSRSFSIRQDDTSVWGFESSGGAEWTLNYAQQVAIHPNGKVEQIKSNNLTRKLLPGKWYVRLQSIQDVGGVLVNGQPAAVYWNEAGGWTDITNMVYADQDNKITFSAWNFEDASAWDFAIKHDETIVWSKTGSGSGLVGKVFEESVTINPKGLVNESQPVGIAADHVWSVIAYRADDASAVFANGELVGVAIPGRNTNWIGINDYLKTDQDVVLAFASFNRRYESSRGFAIRRDDTVVWGYESDGGAEWTLNYAQQMVIHPDGRIEKRKADTSIHKPPPGKWFVRIQNVQDIGAVLVNGQPVAVYWNEAGNWIEITNLLYSDQDNKITVGAWNFEDVYTWDFAIKRDEEILWQVTNNGTGQSGKVFSADVVITGNGELRR